MGRDKGPDKKKLYKIKRVLKKFPHGLWIRELSRKTKIDKSTISRYINDYMSKSIIDVEIGPQNIRIVRLKRKRKKK